MAIDIEIREQLLILPKARLERASANGAVALRQSYHAPVHERVLLAKVPPGAEDRHALRNLVRSLGATLERVRMSGDRMRVSK